MPSPRKMIRGRHAGAFKNRNAFPWSSGVKGLAILAAKSALAGFGYPTDGSELLCGGAKSFASALDSAITKQTEWIMDMFGTNLRGEAFARRVFMRSNSERKRGALVSIRLNEQLIAPSEIEISINNIRVTNTKELVKLIRALEESDDRAKAKPTDQAQALYETAPQHRKVKVCSLIPYYFGTLEGDGARCFGFPAIQTKCGPVIIFPDGIGLLISSTVFQIQNARDFLMQRRHRHLGILAGKTHEWTVINEIKRKGKNELNDLAPQNLAYVMSIHQIENSGSIFTQDEIRCMTEPSLLGIGDDPDDEIVLEETSINAIPSTQDIDVSTVHGNTRRVHMTWANVIIESLGKDDCIHEHHKKERLCSLEVLLQRTWYKLHLLDQMLSSQRLTNASGGQLRLLHPLAQNVQQEYLDLCRPDARATTYQNNLRGALINTSRIDQLYDVYSKRRSLPMVA